MSPSPPLLRRALRAANYRRPSLAVIAARSIALTLGACLVLLGAMSLLADAARAQGSAARDRSPAPAPAPSPPPSAPLAAPEPTVRSALSHLADKHGLWGSIGLGRASGSLQCDACAKRATYAYAGHASLGWRLSPTLLVGAETLAWFDVLGGGVDRIVRGTYLVGRSYLTANRSLFVHGGLGIASYTIDDGDLGFRTQSPSASLAMGYDWRLRSVVLTPTIAAVASTGGPLRSDRTTNAIAENARIGMLRTSFAISWYR